MSRPAHIAPLDAALDAAVAKIEGADAEVTRFLSRNIKVIDEYKSVLTARSDAYHDVRHIEDAIRRLGYVVLGPNGGTVGPQGSRLGDRSYNSTDDEQQARDSGGV